MATENKSIPSVVPAQVVLTAALISTDSEVEPESWQESTPWQDLLSREEGVR
jgi:hypothetical protein